MNAIEFSATLIVQEILTKPNVSQWEWNPPASDFMSSTLTNCTEKIRKISKNDASKIPHELENQHSCNFLENLDQCLPPHLPKVPHHFNEKGKLFS